MIGEECSTARRRQKGKSIAVANSASTLGVRIPICLSLWGLYGERVDGSEDGGGQRAHSQVWCHVGPAHDPTCIDQDGRGERDIMTLMAVSVTQPVGVGGVKVGIREDREIEPGVACQLGVGLDRIDDHPENATPSLAEFVQAQLQTLQLRHAEWSPVTAVEDEEDRSATQVGEPYGLAALVDQREIGRGRSESGTGRGGDDGHTVEHCGKETREHDLHTEKHLRRPRRGCAPDRQDRKSYSHGDEEPVW